MESCSTAIQLVETGATDLNTNDHERAIAYSLRGGLLRSLGRVPEATSDFETALTIADVPFVRFFQQKMQDAGHYADEINGTYDIPTRAAVRHCANDPAC